VVDLIFASDNAYEIPMLDLSMQAKGLHAPLLGWGSIKRGKRINRGTWHGYRDDYRLKSLWDKPDLLVATECNAVIEFNFSLFHQTPLAVAIELTYKKRWLSRYWQSHGIEVWADLNVSYEHSHLNLLGIPQGWRAFATHGYADRIEDLDYDYSLARERAGAEPLFLVYGGGKAVADRCQERGWQHAQEHRNWIREKGIEAVRELQKDVTTWDEEAEGAAGRKTVEASEGEAGRGPAPKTRPGGRCLPLNDEESLP
jgi:hypothetical protein